MKEYQFIENEVAKEQMVVALIKGLGRDLTQKEIKMIHWLAGSDFEVKGVFIDLFTEMAMKLDFGLTDEEYGHFIYIWHRHYQANGTEARKKLELKNMKSVKWVEEENCFHVHYRDDWYHYALNGTWW